MGDHVFAERSKEYTDKAFLMQSSFSVPGLVIIDQVVTSVVRKVWTLTGENASHWTGNDRKYL